MAIPGEALISSNEGNQFFFVGIGDQRVSDVGFFCCLSLLKCMRYLGSSKVSKSPSLA